MIVIWRVEHFGVHHLEMSVNPILNAAVSLICATVLHVTCVNNLVLRLRCTFMLCVYAACVHACFSRL